MLERSSRASGVDNSRADSTGAANHMPTCPHASAAAGLSTFFSPNCRPLRVCVQELSLEAKNSYQSRRIACPPAARHVPSNFARARDRQQPASAAPAHNSPPRTPARPGSARRRGPWCKGRPSCGGLGAEKKARTVVCFFFSSVSSPKTCRRSTLQAVFFRLRRAAPAWSSPGRPLCNAGRGKKGEGKIHTLNPVKAYVSPPPVPRRLSTKDARTRAAL